MGIYLNGRAGVHYYIIMMFLAACGFLCILKMMVEMSSGNQNTNNLRPALALFGELLSSFMALYHLETF